MQRRHAQTIDGIDQMRVRLKNGVHRRHVPIGSGIVQRRVALVALRKLSALVQEQLHHARVTILTAQMQRRLAQFVRLVENTFEASSIDQLPAGVVPSVSKSNHLYRRSHHLRDLLSGEVQRRLPFVGLLVNLCSVLDQRRQHVHLSLARCIVDRIEPVEIALIEQRAVVLASEQDAADGLHGQILHDGEVK